MQSLFVARPAWNFCPRIAKVTEWARVGVARLQNMPINSNYLLSLFVFICFSGIFRLRQHFFSCVLSLVQTCCTLAFLSQQDVQQQTKKSELFSLKQKHKDFHHKYSSRLALGPILGLPSTSLGLFLANFGGPFGSVSSPVCAGRSPCIQNLLFGSCNRSATKQNAHLSEFRLQPFLVFGIRFAEGPHFYIFVTLCNHDVWKFEASGWETCWKILESSEGSLQRHAPQLLPCRGGWAKPPTIRRATRNAQPVLLLWPPKRWQESPKKPWGGPRSPKRTQREVEEVFGNVKTCHSYTSPIPRH